MKPRSIRQNLLLLVLGAVFISWAVVALFVYKSAKHETEEVYDAHLVQSAKLLASLIRYEQEKSHQLQVEMDDFLPIAHKYESKISFIVYYGDGKVMVRSASAPILPEIESFNNFKQIEVDGVIWYTYNLRDPKTNLLIQTAQRYDVRQELINYISSSVLGVMLLSLPFIAILIWITIGRGLRPLVLLADSISGRSVQQLEPITLERVPTEAQPIVYALNSLFNRLSQAFEKERRFTADAAHELRTPLSGIKTQAQVALRSTENKQRQQAIVQVITGVERTTKLVNQLLILARVDAEQHIVKTELNLKQLCATVISEQIVSALSKNIDISLEGESLVTINGNEELIHILIANVINNAIRYTPSEGRIIVSVTSDAQGIVFEVKDSGFGISKSLQTEVFNRFKRGEHSDISGSGLGLSIVLRISELHRARIQLGEGLDNAGLSVKITFEQTA